MEVLEVVDEAGGKVVRDAVDEDLVSQGLLANFRDQLFTSLFASYPRSTIFT